LGLDNSAQPGYTKHRKGAAGRRLAPDYLKEVTAQLGNWGRLLLFAVIDLNEQAANADDYQTKL